MPRQRRKRKGVKTPAQQEVKVPRDEDIETVNLALEALRDSCEVIDKLDSIISEKRGRCAAVGDEEGRALYLKLETRIKRIHGHVKNILNVLQ